MSRLVGPKVKFPLPSLARNKFINDSSQLTWQVQCRVSKCQLKTEVEGRPSSKILGSLGQNEGNVRLKGRGEVSQGRKGP